MVKLLHSIYLPLQKHPNAHGLILLSLSEAVMYEGVTSLEKQAKVRSDVSS